MEDSGLIPDDTKRGWKTQAIASCQQIIAATADGEIVTGEATEFLAWLLDRHPRAAAKIGCGVAGFTVHKSGMGTRCFYVVRLDGTTTEFSFPSCISAPAPVTRVRLAMRRAVADQIIEFKHQAVTTAPLVCAMTGIRLTWAQAHVDHAPPVFIALADEWAGLMGGYPAIGLVPPADGQAGRVLGEADAASWAEFHRERATLRIVSRLANLSLLRRSEPEDHS
jgi:hypothetical protein